MVPKHGQAVIIHGMRFRAVLFRMVPKLLEVGVEFTNCFRAVLFRMVPKQA